MNIKQLLRDSKHASLYKYLISGCITTALDFVIYMCLSGVGVIIPAAKASAGVIVTVLSFVLNRNWSFKAQNGHVAQQGWKFIITQILNISVNTLTNSLVLHVINIKLVAFACATLAGMSVSFALQRCWVFKQKDNA